jgi:hypothetical protein
MLTKQVKSPDGGPTTHHHCVAASKHATSRSATKHCHIAGQPALHAVCVTNGKSTAVRQLPAAADVQSSAANNVIESAATEGQFRTSSTAAVTIHAAV